MYLAEQESSSRYEFNKYVMTDEHLVLEKVLNGDYEIAQRICGRFTTLPLDPPRHEPPRRLRVIVVSDGVELASAFFDTSYKMIMEHTVAVINATKVLDSGLISSESFLRSLDIPIDKYHITASATDDTLTIDLIRKS